MRCKQKQQSLRNIQAELRHITTRLSEISLEVKELIEETSDDESYHSNQKGYRSESISINSADRNDSIATSPTSGSTSQILPDTVISRSDISTSSPHNFLNFSKKQILKTPITSDNSQSEIKSNGPFNVSITKKLIPSPPSGPYKTGEFIKIKNNYKGAKGTIEEVINTNRVYTTISDHFGGTHEREHCNFTNHLTIEDKKLITTFLRKKSSEE